MYGYVQYLRDEMPKLEEMSASFARTVGSDIKAKNKKETAIDLNAIQNVYNFISYFSFFFI